MQNLEIDVNDCEDWSEKVKYEQWAVKKVAVIVKNEEKLCQRTVKVEVECSKSDLLNEFKKSLPKVLQHVANICHQYSAVDKIKKDLKSNEALLHVDFSENYQCKFNREIQSVHFGSSRKQASLHTSVLYYCDPLTGENTHQSYVTISENTRHDPVAILAHLEPLIKRINQLIPNLTTLHFMSDGPSSQYRNKLMFQIFGNQLANLCKTDYMVWHYSESSHGKGAPDGVGGAVKRMADSIVAKGIDIPDVDTLYLQLKENSTAIKIILIPERRISELDEGINKKLEAFKGTNKIHQLSWCKESSNIQARRLSCNDCPYNETCAHYDLGSIKIIKNNINRILLFTRCKVSFFLSNQGKPL